MIELTLVVFQTALIILKILDLILWPWWVVLLPSILVAYAVVFTLLVLMTTTAYSSWADRRKRSLQ